MPIAASTSRRRSRHTIFAVCTRLACDLDVRFESVPSASRKQYHLAAHLGKHLGAFSALVITINFRGTDLHLAALAAIVTLGIRRRLAALAVVFALVAPVD